MNIEFKGTPGPWEVDGVEIRASASHPTERICEMAPGFSAEDAKLIAAAPKLLAALDSVTSWLEWLDDPRCGLGDNHKAVIKQARAALAEALGEQR